MHFLRHSWRFVPLSLPSLFVVIVDLAVSSSRRLPHRHRCSHRRKLLLPVARRSLWRVSPGLLVWWHSVLLLLLHRWSILLWRCMVLATVRLLLLMMAIHLLSLLLLLLIPAVHRSLLHVVVCGLLVTSLLLVPLLLVLSSSSSIGMIWPHLNDLSQHLLRVFNTLSRSLDGDDAVLARSNILVNLDITTGTLLQIIDSGSPLPNNATHVHFGGGKDFTFRSPVVLVSTNSLLLLLVRWRTTVSALSRGWSSLLIATATAATTTKLLVLWWAIVVASSSIHWRHVLSLVWHANVRRSAAPSSSAL
mmetsp:Transcript_28604/g.47339  ORF Transcript_28604/g.47339 Transcript_28604/m.47339 type:complete len:305 (+) Transcript_28604:321-1235(+)